MARLSQLVFVYMWLEPAAETGRRRSSPPRRRASKVTTSTLHLDHTGQVSLDVISHDSNFRAATGTFGELAISHVDSNSKDAVSLFKMDIADPSMYMRSPNVGSDK